MLKIVEFQCPNCELIFEAYIDTNQEEVVHCTQCNCKAEVIVGVPAYGKHGSWSQWSAMDRGND